MNEATAAAPPRACVIGWPVRHSRSPIIHKYWLRTLGMPGSYEHAEIEPDRFAPFIHTLGETGLVGGNVTIPFKEPAFALCDSTTTTARVLGAVNTLWIEGGKLHGDNTDVAGFLDNLDAAIPNWGGGTLSAVVLGAGGAARAVVHALRTRCIRNIVIVNRTASRAEQLAELFASPQAAVSAAAWQHLPQALAGADLIVNTTSLGMVGQPSLEVDLGNVAKHAIVTDLVYVPLETPLLAAARAQGLRTVDGLGMLLHQAVPGFAHWFGERPTVTAELRNLVVADLQKGREQSATCEAS